MSVISCSRLTRRFGSFVAVDDVSFQVEAGEIFGYLGANGAGKSTTIRMLCGLLAPSGGSATVVGHDVSSAPERVKAGIGYMSQKFSLYRDLLVRSNLEFFGRAYGLSRRQLDGRIAEVAELTQTSAILRERTGELPGGLQQRVALASAILHDPGIVFLDEPTAGVDPVSRRGFWRLIRDLAAAGKTVFVTTHYMDEAEFCGRIGLMVDGRLVALDTPARLKHDLVPGELFAVRGRGLRNLRRQLANTPGILGTAPFGSGLRVRVRPGLVAETDLVRLCESAGALEVTVEPAEATLEDVFLNVVTRHD